MWVCLYYFLVDLDCVGLLFVALMRDEDREIDVETPWQFDHEGISGGGI